MFHGVGGVLLIVLANAVLAALATRFFRVRMDTGWGSMVYAVVLTPVPMLGVVLVLSGVFGLGTDLGSAGVVVFVTILAPLALGVAFDYLWMPDPSAVEHPDA